MRISDWSSDVCSSDLIQASGGLADADIDKMVKDAEAHAAEDKKKRALVEARNHADGLVHSTEKTLAEHGDKIDDGEKQAIESDIAELKTEMEGDADNTHKDQTDAPAREQERKGRKGGVRTS